ncbi:MAG: hypothetical protein JWL64_1216 [Frankiales bacterium]|nr:hypothetical protein [Frankiales bacterium]
MTPEQHTPPVYACAAGAVAHGHAGGTLEPAVLLHTFLPPGVAQVLAEADLRVDISADAPGSPTLTVRVLAGEHALAWQLPVAPLVAALPGQLGDDGRMVLLAVVDAEPEPGFWAQAIDCEQLAAELQIPVSDLAEALHGRLISWLAADLEELLHLDAHDRALERSPAQTLADAVLATYRGDLEAQQRTTELVRATEHAPDEITLELAARLCAGLAAAVRLAPPAALEAVRARTGPFEGEVLRLLDELPPALTSVEPVQQTDTTMQILVALEDRTEAVRAAVGLTAALAREVLGPDHPDATVLGRLGMVDDEGLRRLSVIWVELAAASTLVPSRDADSAAALATLVDAEGAAGTLWLQQQAAALAALAEEVAGRHQDRIVKPLRAIDDLLAAKREAPTRPALGACLALARFVRERADLGPGVWLTGSALSAAEAIGGQVVQGLSRETAATLLLSLVEDDVEGPDLLDALVCATSHLLVLIDPDGDALLRQAQLGAVLESVPGRERWLLDAMLRLSHGHDPQAAELGPLLGPPLVADADKAAVKAGRYVLVRHGLDALDTLAVSFGEESQLSRTDVLGLVFPNALQTHDLLRRTD